MRFGFPLLRYLSVVCCLGAVALPAVGDQCIPYCHIGEITVIPDPFDTITAPATGTVEAYYYGHIADDLSYIRMWDLTSGWKSPWELNNKLTGVGTEVDLGQVTKGDKLVFELWNKIQTSIQPGGGEIYYSQPNLNADGFPHFYSAPWSGGVVGGVFIPSGMFMGGEDLPGNVTDWDYNDLEFVWNVATTDGGDIGKVATPEPGGILLLLTAVAGARTARRRCRS